MTNINTYSLNNIDNSFLLISERNSYYLNKINRRSSSVMLEQYLEDLCSLFKVKIDNFILGDFVLDRDSEKMRSLLDEIIKVRLLLSDEKNKKIS